MRSLSAALVVLLIFAPAASGQQADVTGVWDVAVTAKATMRFVLSVDRDGETLSPTLIAPTGETRAAAIAVEGQAVTIRFDLDNPGEPVRVVMKGTVSGAPMKGTADFGGRATAEWSAARRPKGLLTVGGGLFWERLRALCGSAFEGQVIEAPAGDTTFAGKRLVMHVRECQANEIRIPFHVGDDRSRTWVLTRTADGLRLKHDHRHADGTPDARTDYGGIAPVEKSDEMKQEFPADIQTSSLIPEAKTNVWTIEVDPGKRFTYGLRREGTDRRFRIDFDLSRPVAAPPPPWGAR